MPETTLALRDYLETATDAAKRTRTVVIVLVVASVLTFVNFLNSSEISWMFERVAHREEIHEKDPKAPWNEAEYNWLVRAKVDNAFVVRVPFFGIAFDVNDLGLLAGIGFISILALLRYSLRSQIISLRISFKAAIVSDDKQAFYDILGARQEFVFPDLADDKQSLGVAKGRVEKWWERSKLNLMWRQAISIIKWLLLNRISLRAKTAKQQKHWAATSHPVLRILPKSVSLLPFFTYSLIVANDMVTWKRVVPFAPYRTIIMLGLNTFFLLLVFGLGLWCISKWNEIDRLWHHYKTLVYPLEVTGTAHAAKEENEVFDKTEHEPQVRSEQLVTTASKRRYVALLFVGIFIVFTTTRLITYYKRVTSGGGDGGFNLTAAVSTLVSAISHSMHAIGHVIKSDVLTFGVSTILAISTISTIILGWRKDMRDAREQNLKIEQLKRELAAAREKPPLPVSQESRK